MFRCSVCIGTGIDGIVMVYNIRNDLYEYLISDTIFCFYFLNSQTVHNAYLC